MTAFFSDTFAGSGDINGRTPDTTFGSQNWAGGTAPIAVSLSGGYAVATDNSVLDSYGYASVGDGSTNYGNPDGCVIEISFKTGASIATDVGLLQFLASLYVNIGGNVVEGYVSSEIGETTWSIYLGTESAVFSGLAINTEYVMKLYMIDGEQQLIVNSQYLSTYQAFASPAIGLNGIGLTIGKDASVNYITAEEIFVVPEVPGTLPALTIQAVLTGTPTFNANLTLPMLTMDADFGGSVNAELPMLTLYAVTHDASGGNAVNLTLPALTIESRFGAILKKSLPALTGEIAMTGVALITVAKSLPALEIEAELSPAPWQVTADLRLPFITIEAEFGIRADMTLPMLTVEAEGTTGSVINLALTLPMLTMDGGITSEAVISVDLTLPMLEVVANITVNATLPALSIDAYIQEVVTAAYEAYAVNLKHTGKSVDEVTRYTNFPFTHIVRYKNDYFAVAAGGLYLLGGTTDADVVIPWEMETHLTDFGNPMVKTINAAYIGARLGRAETVTLHSGETKDKSYRYSTPRGTGAQNHRQKFGKGIKDRYFALGLEGTGEVAIDDIEFDINTTTRRI